MNATKIKKKKLQYEFSIIALSFCIMVLVPIWATEFTTN
jgi:hypothetical protein